MRGKDQSNYHGWLSKKLEALKMEDYITTVREKFDKNDLYPAHTWAAVKLIILMWWLVVYSKIVPKKFKNFWYIDLLSSSGANFIRESGDIILGSPLLSYLIPYEPFKHYVFVEVDGKRATTLDRMLKTFGFSGYDLFPDDCNQAIYRIPLDAIDNYFCFIDCEGLDIKWGTLQRLLTKRGDILLVFQTAEINRVLGRGKKQEDSQTLNEFCGGDWWKSYDNMQKLLEEYMRRIKYKANELRKVENFTDYIRVRGRKNFYYDVLLVCKKGPYIQAWENLKKKLTNLYDRDVRAALRVCKGNQQTLPDYFITKQSKLDKFLT